MSTSPGRRRTGRRRQILVIDDWLPDPRIGAGAPRALAFLHAIMATGAQLTLLPTLSDPERPTDVPRLLGDVEVATGYGSAGLARFLREREDSFDLIVVSRPHNMQAFRAAMGARLAGQRFIYDSEAIFARREATRRRIIGHPMPEHELAKELESEVALAQGARIVVTVTDNEAQTFRAANNDVRVLGYAVRPQPTCTAFEQRDGFLFVGPFYADGTPNSDSIVWFIDDVLPSIRRTMKRPVPLVLAGVSRAGSVEVRQRGSVRILGPVENLTDVYAGARVFVAPTRFAAGIPIKVYDAAAHGVPVVLTPLLAEQLGWSHEEEALVAESPQDFAAQCVRLHRNRDLWERLRANGLARVARDCAPQHFSGEVHRMLQDAMG